MESSSSPTSTTAFFSERTDRIYDVNLHYRIGGTGSTVVLLHGYADTSHMWAPVMPDLAKAHTVSGHWLLEEAPEKVIPALNEYVH
jgi:hypothetical protein